MENYCAFSRDHKCILWLDYEITRQELEECHTLCHGNWIEIEHKYKYIQELRHLLDGVCENFSVNRIFRSSMIKYKIIGGLILWQEKRNRYTKYK